VAHITALGNGAINASYFRIGKCFTNFNTLLSMLLLVGGIRYLSIQRIQGVTGDVYGASVEIVETTVLISLAMSNG
jgi:cobalamin synthase